MHARVVGQLRVEGSDQEAALSHQHGLAVELGQHLDLRRRSPDTRRADEDATQGLVVAGQVEIGLEARHLPAIGVALAPRRRARPRCSRSSMIMPGARAQDRPLEFAHRPVEPVELHQSHDRRRLAAGNDKAVEPFQLLGLPYLDRIRAEPPQHRRVLAEVALDGQNADHAGITSLVASSSSSGASACGGETAHRLAQAARNPREHLGVAEMRRRLDDRLRPLARVLRT